MNGRDEFGDMATIIPLGLKSEAELEYVDVLQEELRTLPSGSMIFTNGVVDVAEEFGVNKRKKHIIEVIKQCGEEEKLISVDKYHKIVNGIYSATLAKVVNGDTSELNFIENDLQLEPINRSSLKRLWPGQWLDDECINRYIDLLRESESCKAGKSYCFNTFFYATLVRDGRYDFSRVRRWTRNIPGVRKGVDISDGKLNIIGIPVNLVDTHWLTIIIYLGETKDIQDMEEEEEEGEDGEDEKDEKDEKRQEPTTEEQAGDTKGKEERTKVRCCEIDILDSLSGPGLKRLVLTQSHNQIVTNIQRWFEDEMAERDKQTKVIWSFVAREGHMNNAREDEKKIGMLRGELDVILKHCKGSLGSDIRECFTFEELIRDRWSNPQQTNSCDCGIYTIMALRWCSGLAPLFLSGGLSPETRAQIGLELEEGKLIDVLGVITSK